MLIVIGIGLLFLQIIPRFVNTSYLTCEAYNGNLNLIVDEDVVRIHTGFQELGLQNSSVLDSTGIETHIQRLCDGQVTVEQLDQYIHNLNILSGMGQDYGQAIPVNIWDVRTSAMRRSQLTEYDLVHLLVAQDKVYADLLAKSYSRFYQFKSDSSSDSALDTALDLFEYVVEYHTKGNTTVFSDETRLDIVRTWQQIIGHEDRINPLTGTPIIAHTPLSHLNVSKMWHYNTGQRRFIGLIWGVSGLSDQFVGDSLNSNQVEHLAMTLRLQYVDNYALVALNAFEIQDTLSGGQDSQMGEADQNINNIIANQFIPRFDNDPISAIQYLRCVLGHQETIDSTCD